MLPGASPGIRFALLAVLAVPASVLALAVGSLWLLGLLCGKDRREYIIGITQQAMSAVVGIFHGAAAASSTMAAAEKRTVVIEAARPPRGRPGMSQPGR
jgi:hypothetical protein